MSNIAKLSLMSSAFEKRAEGFQLVNSGGGNAKPLVQSKNWMGRPANWAQVAGKTPWGKRLIIPTLLAGGATAYGMNRGSGGDESVNPTPSVDGVQGQGGYNYQTPDWLQGANDWVNDNIPEGFGQVGDFIKNLSPEWKAGLGVGVPMAALLAGRLLTGGRR